jgi:penicillin-binding protein 1B
MIRTETIPFVGTPTRTRVIPKARPRIRRALFIVLIGATVAVLALYTATELVRFRRIDSQVRTYFYTSPRTGSGRPEFLGSLGRDSHELYRPVSIKKLPVVVKRAVLAAEDHRFDSHLGIDPIGILRAAWVNFRSLGIRQGGSTITQQLIKLRLLESRRTFVRKLQELWLALVLERFWSKDAILEAYLNEVYLGSVDGPTIRGIGAASRVYVGKDIAKLTLAEAALLAGMIRAPNRYAPDEHPLEARERRDVVLARMRDLGWASDSDYRHARAQKVRTRPAGVAAAPVAPYFADMVRREVRERFANLVGGVPAAITTTLDPTLQRLAERAVSRGLERLEAEHPRLRRTEPGDQLQAVLIALDPYTGEIQALVGGREYRASQFNRAVFARRHVGSAFKPFVYAAALTGSAPKFSPSSVIRDAPILVKTADGLWRPRNYGDHYEGPVSVGRALAASLNAVTVRVGLEVGLAQVSKMARRLGIESPIPHGPATLLGAVEMTPLELARAYLPFANMGLRPGKASLVKTVRADGKTVFTEQSQATRVLSLLESELMRLLLEDVIQDGTGVRARALGAKGPLAGKTGTTNEGRDAWFVGYCSTLLALVWVGFDNGEPHGLTGAEAALPIWIDFMRQALDSHHTPPLLLTDQIVFTEMTSRQN